MPYLLWQLSWVLPDGRDGSGDGDGTVNVLIIPDCCEVQSLLDVAAVGAEDGAGQHRGLALRVAGPYPQENMLGTDYDLELDAFWDEEHSHACLWWNRILTEKHSCSALKIVSQCEFSIGYVSIEFKYTTDQK